MVVAEKPAEWLTPSQAARRLGVSAQWVRCLMADGHLSHIRTPLGRLTLAQDVERLAAERAQRPSDDAA